MNDLSDRSQRVGKDKQDEMVKSLLSSGTVPCDQGDVADRPKEEHNTTQHAGLNVMPSRNIRMLADQGETEKHEVTRKRRMMEELMARKDIDEGAVQESTYIGRRRPS